MIKEVPLPQHLLLQPQELFPLLNPASASNNINNMLVLFAKSIFAAEAITDNMITNIIANSKLITPYPPKYNILPLYNLICDKKIDCYILLIIVTYVQ